MTRRQRTASEWSGVLVVDKPEGATSHDIVQRLRKMLNTSKVGHLGTLDPMATGVLPVCVGKATRIGPYLPNSPKEYIGEIRFGFSTTTYDREGTPTSETTAFTSALDDVEKAIRTLTGDIDQVAPPFSAKKYGGRSAHHFAREGRPVEIAAVRVTVSEFSITKLNGPMMGFRVVCSPGTYVRSLAHDLGKLLGCGAHLTALRRTRSGDFCEAEAIPMGRLSTADVIPIERLLESWSRVEVAGLEEDRVLHGNPIRADATTRFACIFNKKGEFIAIASVEKDLVCPRLVLTSITSD